MSPRDVLSVARGHVVPSVHARLGSKLARRPPVWVAARAGRQPSNELSGVPFLKRGFLVVRRSSFPQGRLVCGDIAVVRIQPKQCSAHDVL